VSAARRDAGLLALLLLALAGVTVAWLEIDRRPPEWDHANHLERALECHRILAEPGHDRFAEIVAMSSFYPPLVLCAAGLSYFILPVTPLTTQLVMWGFLVAGTLAIRGLGRRLLDPAAGLLAAFFFATAPFVVFSLLRFQLDLPLAAMVALALYTLVRADGFSHPGWSLAVGLAVGLGMLVKPPFAVYILPPLAWSTWLAFRAPDRGVRLRRLGFALAVSLALALPWYGPRLAGMPMQILNRSYKLATESPPTLSGSGLLFYPRTFVPLWGLLAGLLSLWGLWAVRRYPRARALVWSSILPLVIFALIQNKNLRYALPLLPAAALAAAAGFAALGPASRRRVGLACVVVGALQVSISAFGAPPPPSTQVFLLPIVVSDPPVAADWRHAELLAAVLRETGGGGARVSVVPNDNYFSVSNFRYEALRDRLPLRFQRPWDVTPFGVDVAILKTGDQGPDAASARPDRIMRAFDGGDPWLASAFPLVAEVPLPDGSRGMVRVCRPPEVDAAGANLLARRLVAGVESFLEAYTREARGVIVLPESTAERLRRGEVARVTVEADSALVGEVARGRPLMRVRDLRVVARGLRFNPGRLGATGRLEVLDLEGLAIERLRVDEADLLDFVSAQKGLRGATVSLEDGVARVSMSLAGTAVTARVRFLPGRGSAPFALSVEGMRVGGMPVPSLLVSWLVGHLDPTPRLRRLPIVVTLATPRLLSGRLEIGGEAGASTR
jgi:hypothetical protein